MAVSFVGYASCRALTLFHLQGWRQPDADTVLLLRPRRSRPSRTKKGALLAIRHPMPLDPYKRLQASKRSLRPIGRYRQFENDIPTTCPIQQVAQALTREKAPGRVLPIAGPRGPPPLTRPEGKGQSARARLRRKSTRAPILPSDQRQAGLPHRVTPTDRPAYGLPTTAADIIAGEELRGSLGR
jgi:hypothetical protein